MGLLSKITSSKKVIISALSYIVNKEISAADDYNQVIKDALYDNPYHYQRDLVLEDLG